MRPSRRKTCPDGSRNDPLTAVDSPASIVLRGRAAPAEEPFEARPEMLHGVRSAEKARERKLQQVAARARVQIRKYDGWRRHRRLPQVVLLHVVAERTEAHSQQVGSLHLHAVGALERLRDVAALDFLDACFKVEP